jgi:hypothetical protein
MSQTATNAKNIDCDDRSPRRKQGKPTRPLLALRASIRCVLMGAGSLLVVGCWGSGRPDVAPVRGQVTYRGKAVAGATVTFLCEGASRPAFGRTDEAGNYQLTTFEPNDGAAIGTHVVTVTKHWKFDAADLPGGAPAMDRMSMGEQIEEVRRQSALRTAQAEKKGTGLPKKYATRQTSDLRKAVADDDNVIDIELTD